MSGQCFNDCVVGSGRESRTNSNPLPAVRNRSSAAQRCNKHSGRHYRELPKGQTYPIQSYVIYSVRSGISTQHACSGYNVHESGERGAAKRLLVPAGATVSAESGTKDSSSFSHYPWSECIGVVPVNAAGFNPYKPQPGGHYPHLSHQLFLTTTYNNTNTTHDILALHAAAFTMSDKPFPQQPQLHTVAEHRAAVLTYPANLREALRQANEDPRKTLFGVAQGIPSVFLTKVSLLSPSLEKPHTYDCRLWPRQSPTSFGWTLSTAYSTARPSTSKLAIAAMGDWTSKGSDDA